METGKRGTTPQTLRSGLAQSFAADKFPEPMPLAEVPARLAECARLLDAWPNSRPLNRDRTLIEYLNATRGVPIARLAGCVQLAIDAGGEWLPAAGEVLRRAAVQAAGGPVVGTDPDRRYWHELKVSRTVALYRDAAHGVASLNPDALPGDVQQLSLGAGESSKR